MLLCYKGDRKKNYNVFLTALGLTHVLVVATSIPPFGDEKCPCLNGTLNLAEKATDTENPRNQFEKYLYNNSLGNASVSSNFGIGCKPHIKDIGYCEFLKNECAGDVSQQSECSFLDWCEWSFCFVDSENCNVTNKGSDAFIGIDYSYATCGFMDFFVQSKRIYHHRNDTLNVAFNANSGGFRGSFNPEGSFALNDEWHGPLVDFVERSANWAGFKVNMVAPPDFLKEEAYAFFNSTSDFDHCAYAAALGYIDFCVGSFILSEKRLSSGLWFNLDPDAFFLVSFVEKEPSAMASFFEAAETLMKPFSTNAWVSCFFGVIPIMALLMLYFDYGAEGGAFPNRDKKYVFPYIIKSLYEVLLSLFAGYEQPVISNAAKVHLLGIGFFNMLILAVYTANLAAILSSSNIESPIANLAGVRNQGSNICMERKAFQLVAIQHPIISEMLLTDPSDGLPGFNFRSHILDYMKEDILPTEKGKYCEFAIIPEEDFVATQGKGLHCNKTMVGRTLGAYSTGIPVNPLNYESLSSIFQSQLNDGVYRSASRANIPESKCPIEATAADSSGIEMSIQHMAGIWIVSLACGIIGTIFHFMETKKNRDFTELEG